MKALERHQNSVDSTLKTVVSDRAKKALATSIYRQLQDEGCAPKDIISVSSELIDLVTNELTKIDETPGR